MEIIDNTPVWGAPVDDGALRQIKTCYHICGQAAMMADHHKGYGVPIGGVIAHETLVSPIGCRLRHRWRQQGRAHRRRCGRRTREHRAHHG